MVVREHRAGNQFDSLFIPGGPGQPGNPWDFGDADRDGKYELLTQDVTDFSMLGIAVYEARTAQGFPDSLDWRDSVWWSTGPIYCAMTDLDCDSLVEVSAAIDTPYTGPSYSRMLYECRGDNRYEPVGVLVTQAAPDTLVSPNTQVCMTDDLDGDGGPRRNC
jgi:hypothetical protein